MLKPRWRLSRTRLDATTERWQLLIASGDALQFGQVFSQWRSEEPFRTFWSESLREAPFDAYCWECPPSTTRSLSQAFECVFVSSPLLAELPADAEPFAEHFRPQCDVVTFESLGKDALLIAPCPEGRHGNYAHLASFVATAPQAQQGALWKAVGNALETRLSQRPTWLSTAGLGVAWLHVRLDSRPKYYRHAPYKVFDQRLR